MNDDKPSFERFLDQARTEFAEVPEVVGAADAVVERGAWWSEQRTRLRRARRVVLAGSTAYMTVVALLGLRFLEEIREIQARTGTSRDLVSGAAVEILLSTTLPLVAVLVALWLAHRRSVAAQIISRAMLWGMTMIVVVLQWTLLQLDPGTAWNAGLVPIEASAVLASSLTCTGALLVLGNHGLRPPGARSDLTQGLDGLLTLSLVMGLADALVLLTVGSLFAALFASNPVPLLLAVWLLVAAYGLHRRRTWGLLAMAAGNVAELLLAGTDAFASLGPFILILIVTSALQILLPLPVYFAMARRKQQPQPASAWTRKIPAVVLIASAAAATVQWGMAVVGHLYP